MTTQTEQAAAERLRFQFSEAIRKQADMLHDATRWNQRDEADEETGQTPMERLCDKLLELARADAAQQERRLKGLEWRDGEDCKYASTAFGLYEIRRWNDGARTWRLWSGKPGLIIGNSDRRIFQDDASAEADVAADYESRVAALFVKGGE